MSTQSINPYSNQNNSSSNTGKKVGIAAGAVGVAGAGTAAAMAAKAHLSDDEPVVDQAEEVIPGEETPISEPKDNTQGQPQQKDGGRQQPRLHQDQGQHHDQEDNREQGGEHGEDNREQGDERQQGGERQQNGENELLTEDELREYDDNNLDPNTEVDQILAEEQIDQQGDDEALGAPIIHDYESVEMIYGENDEALTVAYAYDEDGNPIALVDIDGDNMFDVGVTENYQMDISEMAINVGDAEIDAYDNGEYLANNGENMENFEGSDFADNIVS